MKILRISAIILINLVIIEVLLRIIIAVGVLPEKVQKFVDQTITWHTQGEMNLVNEAASYVRAKPNRDFQNLDAYGFHSPGVSLDKQNDVPRIAFVGGSTTYDKGPIEETYPYFTSNYLKVKGVPHDFINAGVPGYTSIECLISYQLRIEPWQPNLLVFYNGRNELIVSGNNKYSYLDPTDKYQPPYYKIPPKWHQSLSTISYFYTFAMEVFGVHAYLKNNWDLRLRIDKSYKERIGAPATVDEFISNTKNDDIFKLYGKNVEALAVLTQLNKTNLLLVGFDFYAKKISSAGVPRERKLTEGEQTYLNNRIKELNRFLSEVAARYDHVFFFNLDDKINRDYFMDDCHLNTEGKKQKGDIVGAYIFKNHEELLSFSDQPEMKIDSLTVQLN